MASVPVRRLSRSAARRRVHQRVRMTVKYENYKKFEGKSTIKFGDVVDEKGNPTGKPSTPPATAPPPEQPKK